MSRPVSVAVGCAVVVFFGIAAYGGAMPAFQGFAEVVACVLISLGTIEARRLMLSIYRRSQRANQELERPCKPEAVISRSSLPPSDF